MRGADMTNTCVERNTASGIQRVTNRHRLLLATSRGAAIAGSACRARSSSAPNGLFHQQQIGRTTSPRDRCALRHAAGQLLEVIAPEADAPAEPGDARFLLRPPEADLVAVARDVARHAPPWESARRWTSRRRDWRALRAGHAIDAVEPLVGVSISATARRSVVRRSPTVQRRRRTRRGRPQVDVAERLDRRSAVSKRNESPLISIAASAAGGVLPSSGLSLAAAATSIADPFPQRATPATAVYSLWRLSARASAGNGSRLMKRPRPSSACTEPSR